MEAGIGSVANIAQYCAEDVSLLSSFARVGRIGIHHILVVGFAQDRLFYPRKARRFTQIRPNLRFNGSSTL